MMLSVFPLKKKYMLCESCFEGMEGHSCEVSRPAQEAMQQVRLSFWETGLGSCALVHLKIIQNI